MIFKKYMTYFTVGILALSMLGCTAPQVEAGVDLDTDETTVSVDKNKLDEENRQETPNGYYISPTDDIAVGDVITVGNIVEFDGNYIHIMSGDLIEVFEYNGNGLDFYIGQEVELIKSQDQNTLKAFTREDYTTSHTNMGQIIENQTGEVVERTDAYVVIENGGNTLKISTYEPSQVAVNDTVTVYYMDFGEGPSSIMILNENSKLLLKIDTITRTEEGFMSLLLKDDQNGEYTISASHVMAELDLGSLAVGDIITVYQNGIMESWPMQLDTVLIRK